MTSDIKPRFLNAARRLQAAASKHHTGITLMTMHIVLIDGEPVVYTEPKTLIFEPKSQSHAVREFLDKLAS